MHASFFAFSTIFLTASVVANPITTSQSLDTPRATLVYVNSAQVPIPLPESSTTVGQSSTYSTPAQTISSAWGRSTSGTARTVPDQPLNAVNGNGAVGMGVDTCAVVAAVVAATSALLAA